jgi:hypothetical protein
MRDYLVGDPEKKISLGNHCEDGRIVLKTVLTK